MVCSANFPCVPAYHICISPPRVSHSVHHLIAVANNASARPNLTAERSTSPTSSRSFTLDPGAPPQPVLLPRFETALGTHLHPFHHRRIFVGSTATQIYHHLLQPCLLSIIPCFCMLSTKIYHTRQRSRSFVATPPELSLFAIFSTTTLSHSLYYFCRKECHIPAFQTTRLAQLIPTYCKCPRDTASYNLPDRRTYTV